jgi:hypothetical protein
MISVLQDRDFCCQKLESVITLITRLLSDNYPHTDSRLALESIKRLHQTDKDLLKSISPADKSDTITEFCRRVNVNIAAFHPFLGMLLRSSNLRNAFEIYFPLKLLAIDLLESKIHIVICSEWNFSPYTYTTVPKELPDYIFIGLPASECDNPLIMPLAGHELGHIVWHRTKAKAEFETVIQTEILNRYRSNWQSFQRIFNQQTTVDRLETDLFVRRIWLQSYELAVRQLQEVFCDFVGIFIFGRSFLYSFRYLIAPNLGYDRSANYPKLKLRALYMQQAAIKHGLPAIDGFVEAFSERDLVLSPASEFILKMADETTEGLYKQLLDVVDRYRGKALPFTEGASKEEHARDCFMKLVPPASVENVSTIINAAWSIYLGLDNWDILGNIADADTRNTEKRRVLKDLVLKSLEVHEYNKRTDRNAA